MITNETDSTLDQEQFDSLESLVDQRGIENVLIALSELCGMKAEHVLSNWQDKALAKRWAVIEGAIGVTVPKALGL